MTSSLCKSVLLILHIFLNASHANTTEVRAKGLAESIKRFVEVAANVHAYGFDDKYAKTMQEVIDQIDVEIESKTKEQVHMQIHMQDYKQEVMKSANKLHLLEAQFRDREAPPELLQLQRKSLTLGQDYNKLNGRLDLAQSLIQVTKQVRNLIEQDLQAHRQAMKDGDPNPSQNLVRKQKSERIMLQLAPLIQRAVKLTQYANKLVEEDRRTELADKPSSAKTSPIPHENVEDEAEWNRVEL